MIDATSSPTTSERRARSLKKLFNSKAGAAVAMVEKVSPAWTGSRRRRSRGAPGRGWSIEAKQKKQAAKAKKHDAPVATPVG